MASANISVDLSYEILLNHDFFSNFEDSTVLNELYQFFEFLHWQ